MMVNPNRCYKMQTGSRSSLASWNDTRRFDRATGLARSWQKIEELRQAQAPGSYREALAASLLVSQDSAMTEITVTSGDIVVSDDAQARFNRMEEFRQRYARILGQPADSDSVGMIASLRLQIEQMQSVRSRASAVLMFCR
jgi:hypothetical protein